MVHDDKLLRKMGQAGLCSVSVPQTDSLSPTLPTRPNTLMKGLCQDQKPNGAPSDIVDSLSALLSQKFDLNSEELLMKLQSVINENFELKDTIAQNNLALRQQMNLFVQWNERIGEQHRSYREEVIDARKQSNALKQRNELLKSTLSSFKSGDSSSEKFEELDNAIAILNNSLEGSERKLQTALHEREALATQRTRLESELTLAKCDITASKSDFERLVVQKQEMLSTIKDLREKLQRMESRPVNTVAVKGDAELTDSAGDRKLQKALEEEREANATLTRQIMETKNKVEYLEAEVKVSREETTKYKSKYQLPSKDHSSPPLSPTTKLDETEVRKMKEESAMLKEEVESLESALAEERKRTGEERATMNRLQIDNQRLKKDFQELRDRSERSHYNDQYYMTKIKSVQELHDEATAKIISYEELLGSKNDEIARLKKEFGQTKAALAEMQSEGETIAVLRAQVEVYQSDFRAERESREALAADRERLREDLRHLQARNTQLMDELETYQRRHFDQGPGRTSRSGSEEPTGLKDNQKTSLPLLSPDALWERISAGFENKVEEPPKKEDAVEIDENLLYCPKCDKSFTELRPLEEHVNRCLDED